MLTMEEALKLVERRRKPIHELAYEQRRYCVSDAEMQRLHNLTDEDMVWLRISRSIVK